MWFIKYMSLQQKLESIASLYQAETVMIKMAWLVPSAFQGQSVRDSSKYRTTGTGQCWAKNASVWTAKAESLLKDNLIIFLCL